MHIISNSPRQKTAGSGTMISCSGPKVQDGLMLINS